MDARQRHLDGALRGARGLSLGSAPARQAGSTRLPRHAKARAIRRAIRRITGSSSFEWARSTVPPELEPGKETRWSVIDLRAHPPHHPGMDRRRFLLTSLAGTLAAPLAAEGQPAGRIVRVGILAAGSVNEAPNAAFFDRMRELGYIEGRILGLTIPPSVLARADQVIE